MTCTCGKHIGIGAGGRHVGGWTDPDCAEHKGERPPWMKLDDGMRDGELGPRLLKDAPLVTILARGTTGLDSVASQVELDYVMAMVSMGEAMRSETYENQ